MATFLKNIEEIGEITREVTSSSATTFDTNLTFTQVTDSSSDVYGHLYQTFGLPITDNQKALYGVPHSDGGYSDTALSDLSGITSFIMFNVEDFDGQSFDGKTLSLNIPVSGGTGCLTGSGTTLYGTYMNNGDSRRSQPGCSNGSIFDNLYSDPNKRLESFAPNPVSQTDVEGQYESGLVFLFSDDIQRPNQSGCTSGSSWSTSYGLDNPYSKGKETFNYRGDGVVTTTDKPVGMYHSNSGVGIIFNEDIVNSFNWGGTGTTEAVVTDASLQSETVEVGLNQSYVCISSVGEFTQSSNPTWGLEGGIDNCEGVYICGGGLYNSNNELLAVFTLDEPVFKDKNGVRVFTINLS